MLIILLLLPNRVPKSSFDLGIKKKTEKKLDKKKQKQQDPVLLLL